MNQLGENGLANNFLNENSNSMDSFHYHTNNSNHGNHISQQSQSSNNAQIIKQASNSNDDYGIGNSNDEWHHQSSHMMMHEDSFENFDANNDNDDSGEDDFDDPSSSKRKKIKKTKTGRKKLNELNPDEKPYSCEKCGVKYKTRPGLNYHVQKAHSNNAGSQSSSHAKASKHHHHNNEAVLNPDENTTNSVFDSVYEDMNSSSSLPHLANNNQTVSFGNPSHLSGPPGSSSNQASNYNITNSFNNNINSKNSLNKCGLCGLGTDAHDAGKPSTGQLTDKVLSCSECLKSFHPVCLKFNSNMTQSVKKYNWQCIECKKCVVCGNSENDDKLLFCDDCDRGYHMYCLKPPMSEAPDGDWRCELCVKQLGNQ
jgi:hypothetical protein